MNNHNRSHLNTAVTLIGNYDGVLPFATYIKTYFSKNKKYGSKDRRQIAKLCYSYFRLGQAVGQGTIEECIVAGIFLSTNEPDSFIEDVKPQWNTKISLDLESKALLAGMLETIFTIFPFPDELSDDIDHEGLSKSFLQKPDLFLRIRPGQNEKVISKLSSNLIPFSVNDEACIRLTNSISVTPVLEINKEVLIQDMNSQKVLDQFKKVYTGRESLKVWDCCAASGGKSILFHDLFPSAKLTVSDVRKSIMVNLQKRFREAGITNFHFFINDLSRVDYPFKGNFDIIIADVPCSGSGTWGRTPEQLTYFKKERIKEYAELQKRIVLNASKSIKPGGYLIYITCSVFKSENEDVVSFIAANTSLNIISAKYYKGYLEKADTLYSALLQAKV